MSIEPSATSPGFHRRSLAPRVRAAALHAAVALLASFPMMLSPFSRLVGHEDVDVWNHAWGAWWYWHNLSHGSIPYRTDLLNSPHAGALWYIDPLGALVGMPLVPVFGVVFAYNAEIFFSLLLASVAARRLARAFGASEASSYLASVVLCCSPAIISEIHNGVSEAVGMGWGVLALAVGWEAIRKGGAGRFALLGVLGAVTAIGSYYYAAATALVVGTWALLALWKPERPSSDSEKITGRKSILLGLLLAGSLAAVLVAPVAWAVHDSVSAADAIVVRAGLQAADQEKLLAHNAVDPRTFLWPGTFQSVDLAARGEAFRHSSYLGLLALALALWSRRWRILAGVLVSAGFALGPWLWYDGSWVEYGTVTYRIALPFRALMHVLPESSATHAQRLSFAAIAIVGALAAVKASSFKPRVLAVLGVLLAADGLIVGPSPWPLARCPVLDFHAHEEIGRRPIAWIDNHRVATVLDLPSQVDWTMAASRFLVYQTASGLPIPYRPDARGSTSGLMGVRAFSVLALPSTIRPEHRKIMQDGLDAQTDIPVSPVELLTQGVRWIVVHREMERGTQGIAAIEEQLVTWLGAPEVIGTHAVWDTLQPGMDLPAHIRYGGPPTKPVNKGFR
jgi:hypothetical protein